MDDIQRIAAEEEHLGNWPRRLLHVPSMTSFPWQTGNVYGSAKEPKYNILSYTWGRWRLEDDDEHASQVESVAIAGVPWNIPKVNPSHFTADQFLQVMRSLTRPFSNEISHPNAPGIDFIWVDVACIDQRRGQPEAAAEVGRQADIFRKATRCFAWLASTEESDLFRSLDNIQEALVDLRVPKAFLKEKRRDGEILDIILSALRTILGDPWFSSLWTLQESFLCPHMKLLSRTGRTAHWEHNNPRTSLQLLFTSILADLEPRLYRTEPNAEAAQKLRLILDLTTRFGLSTLSTSNIIAPYIASRNRTASRKEDTIYAIQQIFGFRLGSSALGFGGRSFTLPQLQTQFANKLLSLYPAQSQTFLHTKPAPVGTAWLPSGDSRVPHDIPEYTRASHTFTGAGRGETDAQPPCVLGVSDSNGTTRATFTGLTSPWLDFQTIFTQANQEQLQKQLWLSVCLDAGNAPSTVFNCLGEEVLTLPLGFLAEAQIVVLLLGHYETPSDDGWHVPQTAAVGLILKPTCNLEYGSQPHYRRLGFCVWRQKLRYPPTLLPNNPDFLYSMERSSSPAGWKAVSGLIG